MIKFADLTPKQKMQAVTYFRRLRLPLDKFGGNNATDNARDAWYADPSTRVIQLRDVDAIQTRGCTLCHGSELYRGAICPRCEGVGEIAGTCAVESVRSDAVFRGP